MQAGSVRVLGKLFSAVSAAHDEGVRAIKRSPEDKEYFIQDWVLKRLHTVGLDVRQSGRNSYPDFWFSDEDATVGNEVKSLAHQMNGKPARTDLDFNSTSPKPVLNGVDCSLTFALYRAAASGSLEMNVTTVCVADAAFINDDATFEHVNASVKGFGSYGDALIRNRRMYRFDHPVTIASRQGVDLRDLATLIVPEGVQESVEATGIHVNRIAQVLRRPAAEQLVAYTIDVRTGELIPTYTPVKAVEPRLFDVLAVA